MPRKVKLLFDMEQLSVSGGKGTGVVRVADVLLKGLLSSKYIDVFPLVTTKRGNILQYLENAGLADLKSKIIQMPKLRKTCKKDNCYKTLLSKILTTFYNHRYKKLLTDFDAYLSVFSPISPIIYESKLKTYAIVHDLIPIKFPYFCDAKFAKKYAQWIKDLDASTIFCVSEATKKDLLLYRPDLAAKEINVTYLGAEQKFAPVDGIKERNNLKRKYNIKTKKYFLAVSELSPRKNFVHLLNSFVTFFSQEKAKDISLVLAGPCRCGYNELSQNIKAAKVAKTKIVQTGFVDDEDMAALYSGAEAFIYPSLYEGFGLPVLEAMQCGTPVICANNSSLPEVGGKAAIYINGTDEAETAKALQKIYSNEKLRQTLIRKAKLQAKKFSWNKFINQIEKILLKDINNGKKNKSSL